MKTKVAIIDDEKHACETLKWQLEQLDFNFELIGLFQDPIRSIAVLQKKVPDLIFLDVEMPGLNGFQFLEKLNIPYVKVVFTTAYDKFAVDAFRVNAIDYLIKPVDIADLKTSINRVLEKNDQKSPEALKKLFTRIQKVQVGRMKIGLPSVHGIDFIDCNDIIYCKSESNYTRIYLENDRKILASKTLKEIDQMLPESIFFRLHNSYIANLDKVTSYSHEDGGTIILSNMHKIKVSRNKKKELLNLLNEF